jgi:hypothetical protein
VLRETEKANVRKCSSADCRERGMQLDLAQFEAMIRGLLHNFVQREMHEAFVVNDDYAVHAPAHNPVFLAAIQAETI